MDKMALTRTDLASLRCQDPHCTQQHDPVLVLRSRCHPQSPTWVAYNLSDGTLTVSCAVCNKHVTAIAVAPGGPVQ